MKYPKVILKEDNEDKNSLIMNKSELVKVPVKLDKGLRTANEEVYVETRNVGSLTGFAFFLPTTECDWKLVLDNHNSLCLIAIKKKKGTSK